MANNNGYTNNGNKNNGHSNNGNGHVKPKVVFSNLRLRFDTLERLRVASIKSGLSYSDYIENLMELEVYSQVFDDPRQREVMKNMLTMLMKKAQEMQIQNMGGFNFK
jgi:hypothetical protein